MAARPPADRAALGRAGARHDPCGGLSRRPDTATAFANCIHRLIITQAISAGRLQKAHCESAEFPPYCEIRGDNAK